MYICQQLNKVTTVTIVQRIQQTWKSTLGSWDNLICEVQNSIDESAVRDDKWCCIMDIMGFMFCLCCHV